VLADDIVADDEHDRDSASRAVLVSAPSGSIDVTLDIVDAHAEAWSVLGYAEAGIELNLEVRDGSGVPLSGCTISEELYIARFNESGHPTGTRTLSCSFSKAPGSEFLTIDTEAHAWIGVGGIAGGSAHVTAQIVDVAVETCEGSCAGSCGGQSPDGCFCDDACTFFGDCCVDFAPECDLNSCWENCGGVAPSGACFCDDLCRAFGDCCDDAGEVCDL
jgi:hypothetical protein